MATTQPSLIGRSYLLAVPAVGVAVLTAATIELAAAPPPPGWLLVTALTALTGAYTIKIPGLVVRLSVSEPIVFLSTFLYGPAAGALTAAVDAAVMSSRLVPRLRTAHRILFNVGTVAIAVYLAAQLYFLLAGLDMRRPQYGAIDTFVWPLYVFAGGVFAINSGLVALALGIERRASAFAIWRRQFLWLAATYLASASIAAILVAFTNTFNWALVGLLLPLVAVSFVAVRTTLGRLDDANQHLGEVNTLYLSTIETLAMAIDAKDQVTHGHIRRVQRFAVALANALGVIDDRQLKAIEAAALLHDMGKLAIPEFILNKPGKLTASEFDVMKTHAALGADILASIHFPYPVVPIVRHHHENWDGTGYPDGLKGTAIPIGARILSVVDCYDALTSDRPYRPAMSDQQAIEILLQRRGTMYDPLVVDRFIDSLQSLKSSVGAELVIPIAKAYAERTPFTEGTDAAAIEQQVGSIAGSLNLLTALAPSPPGRPASSVARDILQRLGDVARFDSAAIFIPGATSLELRALASDGPLGRALSQLTIPLAERLTGWVAAHRSSVWNSNAALDLEPDLRPGDIVLASAVPLVRDNELVGVLTLYGKRHQDIQIADRRAIESTIPLIAAELGDSLRLEPRCIDARRSGVRLASFPIVEAAISRSDDGVPLYSVIGLHIEGIRRDDGRPTDQHSVSGGLRTVLESTLVSGLAGHALLLSDASCILVAKATDSTSLHSALAALNGSSALHRLVVRVTRLTTSLDLQIFVRRVAPSLDSSAGDAAGSLVH